MSEGEKPNSDDKTQEPTPNRLRKSREDGDVPYSNETTSAATYAMLFAVILVMSGWLGMGIYAGLTPFFTNVEAVGDALFATNGQNVAAHMLLQALKGPFALLMLLALGALVSVVAQQSFVVSLKKIKPKLSRLSFVDNAKQKYGPNGMAEFFKKLIKLCAILSIMLFAFKDRFFQLHTVVGLPANDLLQHLVREAVFFLGLITAVAVGIAAMDLPWRQYQHRKRLRMSHEEVKRENKENEGDPALKGARRQRAEKIANNRMMADVPNADVVIVNPTHYATALKWTRDGQSAPHCVAKGVDEVAAQIRQKAAENGVPIRRDPPTARSIYALVEIGREIKREHFAAVAAAIHYADQVRKKAGTEEPS